MVGWLVAWLVGWLVGDLVGRLLLTWVVGLHTFRWLTIACENKVLGEVY